MSRILLSLTVIILSMPTAWSVSLDTVEIVPTVNKAYESDPTNGYGVLTFARTGSSGTLYIEFELTIGLGYATPPSSDTGTSAVSAFRRDFTMVQDSDNDGNFGPGNDSDEIEVLNTVTQSYAQALLPFPGTIPIRGVAVIASGRSSTQVRIIPESENPDNPANWPRPELGELVKATLLDANTIGSNYLPNGSLISTRPSYVRGARNSATIFIVDRHARALTQARDAIALETANATRDERTGIIRAWFPRNDINTFVTHPYYTDVNGKGRRILEMSLSGSATIGTDYIGSYKIGGGVTFEGGNATDGYEVVSQGFAYRNADEYGVTMYRNTDDDLSRDAEIGYPNVLRQFTGATSQIIVAGGATLPGGAIPGSVLLTDIIGAINDTTPYPVPITFGTSTDGTTINTASFIAADIPIGSSCVIQYDIFITVGDPPVLVRITQTLNGWTISEPIMYPVFCTSVSLLNSQRLYVGDVFEFANNPGVRHRVTGPTPTRAFSPAHDSGNDPVNLDANPLAVASAGAPFGGFISFTPPLQKEIRRTDDLRIITEFPSTFTGGRQTVTIPQMPIPPVIFFADPTLPRYPDIGQFPENIPYGDWIEFLITPTDDGLVEGGQDVVMTLIAASDYDIGQPQTSRVVIGDNDVLADITVVANAGEPASAGRFRVTFSQPFAKDIEVPYQFTTDGISSPVTVSGASTDVTIDGLDTLSLRGKINMVAGQTSYDITVTPIDDGLFEGTEQVRLLLLDSPDYQLQGSASGNTNPTGATMNVLDASGTVSVSASVPIAYENPVTPTPGVFTVSRTGGTALALNVTYAVALGTGYATPSGDYIALTGQVTIPIGSSSVSIQVVPIDDTVVEGSESVTITINSQPGYAVVATSSIATVQIVDDEPTISIRALRDATELGQDGQFEVSYPGVPFGSALNRSVTIPYFVSGTATSVVDFAALSGTVVIPAGSRSATITVVAVSDTVIDPSESVIVGLAPAFGGPYQTSSNPSDLSASILILDKVQVATNGVIGTSSQGGSSNDCGSGGGTASLILLSLLAIPLIRRRRQI